MLTGNEPVSAGNLKAALEAFSQSSGAMASYEGSETYEGENTSKTFDYTIPWKNASTYGGMRYKNGVFTPRKSGMYNVSVDVSGYLRRQSNAINSWSVDVVSGGIVTTVAKATSTVGDTWALDAHGSADIVVGDAGVRVRILMAGSYQTTRHDVDIRSAAITIRSV